MPASSMVIVGRDEGEEFSIKTNTTTGIGKNARTVNTTEAAVRSLRSIERMSGSVTQNAWMMAMQTKMTIGSMR